MIYSVDVQVSAPVRDTELADRVARAVENLFPGADAERQPGRVVAETHSLDAFARKLREQRIVDTARTVFHEGRFDGGFAFDLKKQAAFEGVVNFAVGNPDELGDVHVRVAVTEPSVDEFVAFLAPETDSEGRPVDDPMDR